MVQRGNFRGQDMSGRQVGLKRGSFLSIKISPPAWNTEFYAFMKFSPILWQWISSTFSTWTHTVLWADVSVPVKNMQNLSFLL